MISTKIELFYNSFIIISQIGNLQDHFRFLLQGELSGLHMSSKSEAISQEKQVMAKKLEESIIVIKI